VPVTTNYHTSVSAHSGICASVGTYTYVHRYLNAAADTLVGAEGRNGGGTAVAKLAARLLSPKPMGYGRKINLAKENIEMFELRIYISYISTSHKDSINPLMFITTFLAYFVS
jgi:hypothetical protein